MEPTGITLPPGTVLLGKYRIERILGEGGMGVVALAHHIQLDQPVAIKFLRPEVLANETVVVRFLREARAAVKLKSEHVCKVYDVGTLDNGSPYMVMEFMEGAELAALTPERGRLSAGEIVELVLQVCEALAEAHALGIVHRDIKPANLFVTRRPDGSTLLKVLDFGISKVPAAVDTELTNTQAVMGTPAYMSPEQMRASKHVDARTDIWALGVVLYELLNGRRPFLGRAYSELCLQIGMDRTPAMDASVPPGLDVVVARCLEKDPARRFQNMAELAAALAPYSHDPMRASAAAERAARILGVSAIAVAGLAGMASSGSGGMAAIHSEPTLKLIAQRSHSTLSAGMGQVAIKHTAQQRRWLIVGAAVATLASAVLAVVLVGGVGGGTSVGDSGVIGTGEAGKPAVERDEEATEDPEREPSPVQPDESTEVIMDAGVDGIGPDAIAHVAVDHVDEAEEEGQERTPKREAASASSRKGHKQPSRKIRGEEQSPARIDKPRTDKAGSPDDPFGHR